MGQPTNKLKSDGNQYKQCKECSKPFEKKGKKIFCSDTCKGKDWRKKHPTYNQEWFKKYPRIRKKVK